MKRDTTKRLSLICLLIFAAITAKSQMQDINVLFLGNSYTAVNNLPQTISDLLEGSDKTMSYSSNTPGGCCFFEHVESTTSLNLIRRGDWNYVVLQEQSQMPSIDYYRYASMYPAATRLRDTILRYNPCAEVVFYMTWGRRDGGQQCENYGQGLYCSADFVDFDHMQDTMTRAYCEIAEQLQSIVSPAGEAWRKARQISDINLFSGDGSHPSIYGTYLTACTFYATFWGESPVRLPHPDAITDEEAQILQKAAFQTVFDDHSNWNFTKPLVADFKYQTLDRRRFFFTNATESSMPLNCHWDFGDGSSSNEENPIHDYTESGFYTVKLNVSYCQKTDSTQQIIEAYIPTAINEHSESFVIYPNPSHGRITISGNGHLTIYNLLGQSILEQQVKGESVINLERGIYIASFSDSTRTFRKKVVVR